MAPRPRKHRTAREARMRDRTGDPLVRAALDAVLAVRVAADDLAAVAVQRKLEPEAVTFEAEPQDGGQGHG